MSALTLANVLQQIVAGTYTSTETGTGVDVTAAEGMAIAVLNSSAGGGTTPTLDVKLQSCSTVGGTYADISGATFTQITDSGGGVQMIAFNIAAVEAFVRALGTIAGGGGETFDFSVTLIYMKKAVG